MAGKNGDLRWPLIIGGTIVVAAIVAAIWLIGASLAPLPEISTPKMPQPNAYDYYVAAGRMLQDGRQIQVVLLAERHARPPGVQVPRLNRRQVMAAKAALLRKNGAALAKLREGFRYECRHPADRELAPEHPEYAHLQRLATLLAMDSQVRAARGDYAGAARSCLDIIQLGVTMARGGGVMPMLIGAAIRAIGRREFVKITDRLDSGTARRCAKQMEALQRQQPSLADALTEEKWQVQAGLTSMFAGAQAQARDNARRGRRSSPTRSLVWWLMWRQRVRNYVWYMDECIANARLPYAAKAPDPPIPRDPMCEIFCPVLGRCRFGSAREEGWSGLLTATLALRAYRLDHGGYPGSLTDLVPSYLKRIPDDPFALKWPLRYKQGGARYVLYSVGPDGKDDGGAPAHPRPKVRPSWLPQPPPPGWRAVPKGPHSVQEDSQGDIVAGVNIQ